MIEPPIIPPEEMTTRALARYVSITMGAFFSPPAGPPQATAAAKWKLVAEKLDRLADIEEWVEKHGDSSAIAGWGLRDMLANGEKRKR